MPNASSVQVHINLYNMCVLSAIPSEANVLTLYQSVLTVERHIQQTAPVARLKSVYKSKLQLRIHKLGMIQQKDYEGSTKSLTMQLEQVNTGY